MTTVKAVSGSASEVASAKASPRERLLDAAAELFEREGVGVGTDALCRAAGVSKRSMYQLFDSKDAIIAAALERRARAVSAFLLPPPDAPGSPRERMLYVFRRLEEAAQDPGYCGCPHVSTLVELKDLGHPASVVALRYKAETLAFLRAEAERAGAADPELLARRLALVFDGAATRAGTGVDRLDGLALSTAAALIDAACAGR
ncbi:TetR/AcrR family transcriptional regulator [Streptomyces thermoviolaceus]|uniref:TetR/AcrR family transcriptional regulator n=1 Tax=Streptomyces thermoviolaceus subsp. thermoviolaceus TaxID=66860 RepID=A0ABX0YXH1_STRTL|nr:TetR/AcrR family transcriptional regulator [Streptomyces thermoviolaceus]NJP17365.1 TetR/AcrR family transcriptional regulator [Streptomyces thermoviolaceus subsp. thermoviolaceus]WTD46163.1 TetR/AcrR family transcriptional regulator [Streptomyces thermoviolaceus]